MRRFAKAAVLMTVSMGVVVIAQAKITTVEEYSKVMKSTSQAMGVTNKAIGSGGFAEAKTSLATVRQNFVALQGFWTEKKKDDAVGIVKDALTKVDVLDKMLAAPTVDQASAQAAAKDVQGACGACHKLYREGDNQTGYRFKPGIL
jgi:cytochrome c556